MQQYIFASDGFQFLWDGMGVFMCVCVCVCVRERERDDVFPDLR
jgi:hypothetical protein